MIPFAQIIRLESVPLWYWCWTCYECNLTRPLIFAFVSGFGLVLFHVFCLPQLLALDKWLLKWEMPFRCWLSFLFRGRFAQFFLLALSSWYGFTTLVSFAHSCSSIITGTKVSYFRKFFSPDKLSPQVVCEAECRCCHTFIPVEAWSFWNSKKTDLLIFVAKA